MPHSYHIPILVGKAKDRFLSEYAEIAGSDCLHWIGPCDGGGHPKFFVGGRSYNARAIAYRMFVGNIPRGAYTVTTCKKRCCMNPQHLTLISARKGWYGRYGT